jgi:predicted Rossmann fold flavoprotein
MFLLSKNEIDPASRWHDLAGKSLNKLVNTLINDRYEVKGKTTFKEEFVTAGGVDLAEIQVNTMESTVCPGLFFAGEVMDIDGITGGFNFQAAWTTGYIAGKNAGNLA